MKCLVCVFPLMMADSFSLPLALIIRLDAKSEAHPVRVFLDTIQSRFIGIQLSAGQRIGVDKDMAVDMSAVCMRCNHDLTVIPEGLARKRLCDAMSKFRRDIVLRIKRLDIVNCLYAALTFFRRWCVESLRRVGFKN